MPKGKSGIKRGGSGGKGSGTSQEQPKASGTIKTYNESSVETLNLDKPDSMERLKEMASRGEFPLFVDASSREARERFYEEFDRLYPDPPGILNDYRVLPDASGRSVEVYFNYNMAEAESPGYIRFTSRNASEAVKRGQIKHAIYGQRSAVEYALSSRRGSFSSYDLAEKYGGRILSKAERDAADREIISTVERLLGSPMTQRGLKMNATMWKEQDGGYFRLGTERFAS